MSASFHKQSDGGYAFSVPGTEATYTAYRNEAGFAGRAWYLTRRNTDGGFEVVADMLASRNECVEVAHVDVEERARWARIAYELRQQDQQADRKPSDS